MARWITLYKQIYFTFKATVLSVLINISIKININLKSHTNSLCVLPVELGECWLPLLALLGATLLGGLPPVDRGLPGGKLSATDIRAAMGLCPDAPWTCPWGAPGPLAFASGGDPVRLSGELLACPDPIETGTGREKHRMYSGSSKRVKLEVFSYYSKTFASLLAIHNTQTPLSVFETFWKFVWVIQQNLCSTKHHPYWFWVWFSIRIFQQNLLPF